MVGKTFVWYHDVLARLAFSKTSSKRFPSLSSVLHYGHLAQLVFSPIPPKPIIL